MFRRFMLTGILVVGVVSGFIEQGSVAYFTGAATSAANQFVSGSVTLDATIASGDTLAVGNLVPGDTVPAQLNLTNSGTIDLRYAMTASTSGDATLISTMLLTIRTKTANPCSSQDGTVLFGPAAPSGAALGNPSQGAQAGDRTVTPSSTESLCFSANLPATVPTSLQGASMTAIFTFRAEQVVNNP